MRSLYSYGITVFMFSSLMVLPAMAEIKPMPDVVKWAVEDKQHPLQPDQVKLTGMLGERIGLCEKNRLLTIDEDLLLDGFRKRPGEHPWIGEHVGKWMHAATLMWVYTGDEKLKEKIDRVATGLMATQMPDGYLGTYLEKDRWTSWDVWSHKYCLMGLLTYYRYTGNKQAMETCRKMGDLLYNTFGKDKRDIIKAGEHVGMAATSVLEPMVLLYRASGEQKYLDFCHYILWSWEQPHGPMILSRLRAGMGVNKVGNGKAYEMLSNFVGICELYRTTGEDNLLQPMIHAWEDIVKNRLYISGSASQHEHFKEDGFLPDDVKQNVMETCVTVTWMQFNAQLLRLTDEPRFADQLERTVYNQLLFAQKPDGTDFCYYNPLAGKRVWEPLGKPDIHCCLSSGPRGLALIPTFVYGINAKGPVVNFFEAGQAELMLADGTKVKLEQQTQYPWTGEIVVRVKADKPRQFSMQLRDPSWCLSTSMAFDDSKGNARANAAVGSSDSEKKSKYASQTVSGQAEGKVTLKMDIPIHEVDGFGTNKDKVAILRGPLVLAANEELDADLKPLTGISIPPGIMGTPLDDHTYAVPICPGGKGQVSEKLKMIPLAFTGNNNANYQVWFSKADPGCGK